MKPSRLTHVLFPILLLLLCLSDGWTQPQIDPRIDTGRDVSLEQLLSASKVVQIDSVLKLFTGEESTWPIQRTDRWCWAATAEIIMSSYGQTSWKQCIQADDAYPGKTSPRTCCDDPENTLCNRRGWPHFEYYNFNSTPTPVPLTWMQLKDEIDRQRPVAVAVKYMDPAAPNTTRNDGHMGTIAGYAELAGGERVILAIDPDGFHVGVWALYEDIYGESSEIMRHWRSYYEIYPYP